MRNHLRGSLMIDGWDILGVASSGFQRLFIGIIACVLEHRARFYRACFSREGLNNCRFWDNSISDA